MIKLTKRTEYGLIALIHLAEREGQVVSAREIGETYPVPRRLLAEVLKDLQHAGLVLSTRGAHGGYTLAEPIADISLGRVVALLEGSPTLTDCQTTAGGANCEVHASCPIRDPLDRIKSGIWNLMEQTSLRSLMERSPMVPLGNGSLHHHPSAASKSE
ncbi:MAG: Rrf2 family transcriptional regulator [Planctomycetes bacterium]|nr:Rrf2 family transcriptional regulator [Planctomycetota bacterium]MCB9910816.1 Rrf2 family transcriptional regulator [Planctomycetota bacterium]MCB9912252.1 Rrf2 family transcriptional regulator [Planctomycetota bacterium]HPF12791.1 Rrf2 family transcriptional regulator [Planctomycetota bacterium]